RRCWTRSTWPWKPGLFRRRIGSWTWHGSEGPEDWFSPGAPSPRPESWDRRARGLSLGAPGSRPEVGAAGEPAHRGPPSPPGRGLRSARACTKSRRGRWAGRGTSRTAELAGEVGLSRAVRRAQVSGVRGPIFGRSLHNPRSDPLRLQGLALAEHPHLGALRCEIGEQPVVHG